MLTIDESFLRGSTRQAIQAARDALASDPANLLTQQVTKATTGDAVSLVLTFGLGLPANEDATTPEPVAPSPTVSTPAPAREPEANVLTAADVRARAEEVGFHLNGRPLRSQTDKEAALAEIEAWVAEQSNVRISVDVLDPPDEEDENEDEDEESEGDDFPDSDLDDILSDVA